MSVGEVLSDAIELYGRFFWRFVGTAAAVFVLVDLLVAIAVDARSKGHGIAVAWTVVAVLASIVGSFWVQGALIEAVRDAQDGKIDMTIGELYQRTRPYLGSLIAAWLVLGVIAVFLALLLAAIPILFAVAAVPALFVLTRWSLLSPVIVLERKRAAEAFPRSWSLVRGHGWRVFAVLLVTLAGFLAAHAIFTLIFAFLPSFLSGWIGGLIADSLVTPFVALTWTVMYLSLARRARTAQPGQAAEV